MLGQLLANSFKSKYLTVNSVTLQALLPQVLRLQRLFQTVLRLWFNFHVWYLVASLGKPCIQKPLFKTSELAQIIVHMIFRIFVDSKQSKLIPSISPVRDECCIIILWKICSTFGSYLPETVVELRKFFCCSFLNFDLLLAQLSSPHSCRRWKYEYCFCENISHAKNNYKTTRNNHQCLVNVSQKNVTANLNKHANW